MDWKLYLSFEGQLRGFIGLPTWVLIPKWGSAMRRECWLTPTVPFPQPSGGGASLASLKMSESVFKMRGYPSQPAGLYALLNHASVK